MNASALALSTGCFFRKSIFDIWPIIKEAGFSCIEVCSNPDHLDYHDHELVQKAAELLKENELDAVSFHAPFAQHINITSSDRNQYEESLREIMTAVHAAQILGVSYFVIHPGPEQSGSPPEKERYHMMNTAVGALRTITDACRDRGMYMAMENMLPHLLFGHANDLLWMVGSLDPSRAGVCLDTGHAHLSGDIDTAVARFSGHLKIIHLHDNHGSADEHLPPGDGSINWEKFTDSLADSGFSGPIVLELAGDNQSPKKIMANARRALRVLHSMVSG